MRERAESVDLLLCASGPADHAEFWAHAWRALKPAGVVIFSNQEQPDLARLVMSNPKTFRYTWPWTCSEPFAAEADSPLMTVRHAAVFYRKLPFYNPQMGRGKAYTAISSATSESDNYNKGIGGHLTVNKGTRHPLHLLHFNKAADKALGSLHDYLCKTYVPPSGRVLELGVSP